MTVSNAPSTLRRPEPTKYVFARASEFSLRAPPPGATSPRSPGSPLTPRSASSVLRREPPPERAGLPQYVVGDRAAVRAVDVVRSFCTVICCRSQAFHA